MSGKMLSRWTNWSTFTQPGLYIPDVAFSMFSLVTRAVCSVKTLQCQRWSSWCSSSTDTLHSLAAYIPIYSCFLVSQKFSISSKLCNNHCLSINYRAMCSSQTTCQQEKYDMCCHNWLTSVLSRVYIHSVAFSPRPRFSLVYRDVSSVQTLPGMLYERGENWLCLALQSSTDTPHSLATYIHTSYDTVASFLGQGENWLCLALKAKLAPLTRSQLIYTHFIWFSS